MAEANNKDKNIRIHIVKNNGLVSIDSTGDIEEIYKLLSMYIATIYADKNMDLYMLDDFMWSIREAVIALDKKFNKSEILNLGNGCGINITELFKQISDYKNNKEDVEDEIDEEGEK